MAYETNVRGAVTLDFTGVGDGGGKYITEAGKYLVLVQKVLKKESQNSEYPFFEWTLEAVGPASEKGKTIRHFTSLKPEALFNLRNTIMAIMEREIPKGAVSLDFNKLLGRKLAIEVAVKNNPKDNKDYARIVATFPASKFVAATPAAVDDEVEEIGTLEEADLG